MIFIGPLGRTVSSELIELSSINKVSLGFLVTKIAFSITHHLRSLYNDVISALSEHNQVKRTRGHCLQPVYRNRRNITLVQIFLQSLCAQFTYNPHLVFKATAVTQDAGII